MELKVIVTLDEAQLKTVIHSLDVGIKDAVRRELRRKPRGRPETFK